MPEVDMKLPQGDENSPDFTAEEAERAIPTANWEELARLAAGEVRDNPGCHLDAHQLRQWNHRLFWRAIVTLASGEEKVLLYLVDWLQGETHADRS